ERIIALAIEEQRIILTRDKGILKNGRVTHGYWLRATEPVAQLEEVVRALDLARSIRAYSRCMECNGSLQQVERSEAAHRVPLQVFLVYRDFSRCGSCGRMYWAGSHQTRLDDIVERARVAAFRPSGPAGSPCSGA
ncbi:MAG: Mut7-C RNAse domain-containing protein, partial [Woeseiaceae bacterium]